MFGKVRASLRMLLLILSIPLLMLPYYISSPLLGRSQDRRFRLRRKWVHFVMWVLGIKVELSGNPNPDKKPILYVSNHRTFTDPVVVTAFIDAFAIAKAEVSSYPLIGRGAKETGVIFVHRDKKSSRNATKDAIEKALSEGKNILIYPEGTTGDQVLTKEFKKGSFDVAAEHQYAVVPVTLEYADTEKDYWFQRGLREQFFRQYSKSKTYTKIHFSDPVFDSNGLQLMEKAQKEIDTQIQRMHRDWGG